MTGLYHTAIYPYWLLIHEDVHERIRRKYLVASIRNERMSSNRVMKCNHMKCPSTTVRSVKFVDIFVKSSDSQP